MNELNTIKSFVISSTNEIISHVDPMKKHTADVTLNSIEYVVKVSMIIVTKYPTGTFQLINGNLYESKIETSVQSKFFH